MSRDLLVAGNSATWITLDERLAEDLLRSRESFAAFRKKLRVIENALGAEVLQKLAEAEDLYERALFDEFRFPEAHR